VRWEKTADASYGWAKAHTGTTPAQQAADPVGSAKADYANTRREIEGSYTKAFPGAHLTYDVAANVRARLSWSTSFGRPVMTNLLPSESFSDSAKTLTINNASLKPQTSRNWDATLAYYFEPVGNLSAGWFHKAIKDFIVGGIQSGTVASGTNNGYNGEYGGYTILTSLNAGDAYVQGWELNYQQQFTFLPGLLRGISVSANYTQIATHGDFGSATDLTTNQVEGFVPKTANLSLAWRYRGFGVRLLGNYTSDYIKSYSAGSVGRNQYMRARTIFNAGFSYQLRPAVSLTCDLSNLTNEPIAYYRGIRDQMERTIIHGTTINFGVTGRF
jgi:iron complex outermembrane receptor protein